MKMLPNENGYIRVELEQFSNSIKINDIDYEYNQNSTIHYRLGHQLWRRTKVIAEYGGQYFCYDEQKKPLMF